MPVVLYGNNNISGTGVRFNLNARNISFGYENFNEAEPKPGISIGSPWNERVPQHRYNGHGVPVVNLVGFIAVDQPDPTYIGGRPIITEQWLGSLVLIGSGLLYYRPIEQFIGSPWNGAGSIPAAITNVKLTGDTNYVAAGSEYLNFNLDFILVSGPV